MAKKSAAKKAAPPKTRSVRKLPQPTYRSFRLSKRIKQPKAALPNGFRLFKESAVFLWANKRRFGLLSLIAFLLSTIFVTGTTGGGAIIELKSLLDGVLQGAQGKITTGIALFSILLTGAGSEKTETAAMYQTIVMVITSLAFIWAIRHTMADPSAKLRVRDAFYKGMYPLVPFLLVLGVIGLQLLPLVAANFLYSVVLGGGLAVTMLEQVLWLLLIGLLALLSLYLVSGSVFALYIVTLADVDPIQSIRSSLALVRHRRWSLLRKVLVLPLCMLLVAAVIIIPIIIVYAPLAQWVFYFLSAVGLLLIHTYLYTLYRKLL
jgi:hypothetical protein